MNPIRADHISPLDIFKIGIGPSSSHTMGPMVAALAFRQKLIESDFDFDTYNNLRLQVELFGSLSATGKGHATDGAICAGLSGLHPKSAEPKVVWAIMPALQKKPLISFPNWQVAFEPDKDIIWSGWRINDQPLPHPNIIRFRLLNRDTIIKEQIVMSVGGGFVEFVDSISKKTNKKTKKDLDTATDKAVPYPYNTAAEFVEQCTVNKLAPWQIVIANEEARGIKEKELRTALTEIWHTMEKCIERGISTDGILPGGLNVRRRAKALYSQMLEGKTNPWSGGDLRPSVYAMAVNEENAAGGRVVTAPTNGSSGLIPAVWRTLKETEHLTKKQLENGFMVAAVIGALVKVHASISGAEVGCQGEVGTSCAMAAAGAVTMLGGTPNQIEQAAEIGIEHHLGLTCDPINGLVQIPCIERNAMGAVKALNAAALALASDGKHMVSLDRALEVMKQTGLDMNQKYKETSTGGLALG